MIPRTVQAESFTLQLSTVTPADDLRRWLEVAPVGHRVVYASGVDLPRSADSVVLAREWQEQGLVNLFQLRDPVDTRRWLFWMQRAGAELPDSDTPGALDKVLEKRRARKLLNLLRDIAESGAVCGFNNELADQLRKRNPELSIDGGQVRYLMGEMEKAGGIAVQRRGTTLRPIVTILAAGRAKGRSTGP